jgi:drug/metabolite transporter (DMT)-like permease
LNPIWALIIANIIWGVASPIFKFALENIPPFTLAFIRFFFAGLIFIPLTVGHWQKLSWSEFFNILLVGFFGITINIAFFFMGLEKTTSITAPIIASSGPVFIYFFSVIFLKEQPRLKIFSGMLLAFFGVLFIIFSPFLFDGKKMVFGQVEGNLLLLIATLATVPQALIGKKVLEKINVYQVSLMTFLFGSLTFFPLMMNELRFWSFESLNSQGWLGIIFGVFFSSALAYFLFYYGTSKILAQEAALFTYIDPIMAMVVAAPLLGEYPTLYFFIGSVFVFGGIYLAESRLHWHPFYKLRRPKNLI